MFFYVFTFPPPFQITLNRLGIYYNDFITNLNDIHHKFQLFLNERENGSPVSSVDDAQLEFTSAAMDVDGCVKSLGYEKSSIIEYLVLKLCIQRSSEDAD